MQVILKTDGRPLDNNVKLWTGPDNISYKMGVYVDNGAVPLLSVIIETQHGPNTIVACVVPTSLVTRAHLKSYNW